ncbi:DUF3306 domain-containing protein [Bradyrhizobium lablabi]|uniref:DUF3306 domain-containing protein n=1 Tax=Bradyrhizobium lablabi TaxID=722472 RepID=UPI001BAC5BB8|nr:DUF3306 domain-containing protein [Bradyrhizobium lablabi]MBR1122020.1 DUF3306 domain-containing protein [Bradyrhizobium lablabi]
MTGTDNFLLRWARLKRESNARHEIDDGHPPMGSAPQGTAPARSEAAAAQPSTDAAAGEPFDPSTLPSIEAITAETDIRGFLQSGVPLELSIAALRRAWTSDPAIRDFIGIAENQWDFNDPNSIPGFGPLGAAGDKPARLTQILGEFEKLPEASSQPSTSEALAPSRETVASYPAEHGEQKVVELASADTDACRLSNQPRATDPETEPAVPVDGHDNSRNRRRHGSALPR